MNGVNQKGSWSVSGCVRPDPEVGLDRTVPVADEESSRDEALDVLFRRHYTDLVRLAFCLVGDRPQSEDIVQDAFVALYRHGNDMRDREAALGNLRSEVLSRSRSRLRVVARDRRTPVMRLVDVQPEDVPGRASTLVSESRLLRAVQGLPRRQFEVVPRAPSEHRDGSGHAGSGRARTHRTGLRDS